MLKRLVGTRHQGASIALGVEPIGINNSLNVVLHAAYLLTHSALFRCLAVGILMTRSDNGYGLEPSCLEFVIQNYQEFELCGWSPEQAERLPLQNMF